MKIPLSWLEELVALPKGISIETIEDSFVRVGFEVEAVVSQGQDISGPLVVGLVVDIEELVGHKKPIRYVELNVGEKNSRFVICGATNFGVGDLIVAALPGAILPGSFEISQRETYGKISNGMICSARELGISDEHAGIIVLPSNCALPGVDAMELLEIRDSIFDLAINPDRGYAMSARGLGRELAAALGVEYKDPVDLVNVNDFEINKQGIQIAIEDSVDVPIAVIRSLSQFNPLNQSPLWMRRKLEKCGMRSISLAVDITNYVMLELGQPLHAFDSQKIDGRLTMRRAGSDQTLKTLDGQLRKLDSADLVVADNHQPLSLAGVMGGASSEVTEKTTEIALEAARFSTISIAQSSRRHKLSSEASRRLERGVDPLLAEIASARALSLMCELGGGKYVGTAIAGKPNIPLAFLFDPNFVTQYLGFPVALSEVEAKLKIVGVRVEKQSDNKWSLTPPTWRPDLLMAPDFVEEVARMIGLDSIPSKLPTGKSGAGLNDGQKRRRSVSQFLADNGFTEVYNYPFVNPEFVAQLGFTGDRAKSFRIANPMSEEFPDLRTHLLPGLLTTVLRNLGRGAKSVAIFEVGTVFRNLTALSKQNIIGTSERPSPDELKRIYESVPDQPLHIGAVIAGKLAHDSWREKASDFTWSEAIGFAQQIVTNSGNSFTVHTSDFAPWHPGRCAEIRVAGKPVGHAGELHPGVIAKLGLPERSCAFVVVLSALPFVGPKKSDRIVSMPAAVQDIAVVVDESVSAAEVEAALRKGAGELLEKIELFDRYDKMGEGKVSLAYSLTFRATARTLTAEEVTGFRLAAFKVVEKEYNATLRS